jgi:hypothetical protein
MKKELLSLIESFEHTSQFEAMNMLLSHFYNYHMISMDDLNELASALEVKLKETYDYLTNE